MFSNSLDTAFHADRPRHDRLYGLPRSLSDDGIIAYGFHGLSYQHVAAVLRARDGARGGGRAIVAHLGSGASLCAGSASGDVLTGSSGANVLSGLAGNDVVGGWRRGRYLRSL
jgi:acetate kinase